MPLPGNRKYDPDKVKPDALNQAIRSLPNGHSITFEGSGVKVSALGGMGPRRFIVEVPVSRFERQPVRPEPYPGATPAIADAMKAHNEIKLGMGT
jgi:hypothetical protein